jgi:hypothetical protein
MNKDDRKHICTERGTIHLIATIRIFSSSHITFALSFGQKLKLHTIVIVYQFFQPT